MKWVVYDEVISYWGPSMLLLGECMHALSSINLLLCLLGKACTSQLKLVTQAPAVAVGYNK